MKVPVPYNFSTKNRSLNENCGTGKSSNITGSGWLNKIYLRFSQRIGKEGGGHLGGCRRYRLYTWSSLLSWGFKSLYADVSNVLFSVVLCTKYGNF
jgi:hypothetical protein